MSPRINILWQRRIPEKAASIGKRKIGMYFRKINFALEGREALLYVTDDRETAQSLRSQGEAVVVYLHPGNREEDFSAFLFAVEDPEDLEAEYVERVYRRLKGMPWNILETERCLIRETTPEDVEDFYRIYSHPSITKYMEGLYPEVEAEKAYVREYIEKVYTFFGFGIWTVVEKAGGAVIGRAGFSYREGFQEPELGFIIGVPWQRQGYAEEVCRGILDYGRRALEFTRVQALVEPGNTASLKLCGKLGFFKEETLCLKGKEYCRLIVPFQAG